MSKNIPNEMIEEIRYRTNIVDVVGQYVQLKKSGKNYFGLCPFHDERSPSFSVAEDKQIFHCFGCGKGGNVFQFVQEIDGLSFPEAVEKVADFGQMALPDEYKHQQQTSDYEKRHPDETRLMQLHEKAADLYHHVLMHTKAGEEALDYLLKRGLTEELITTFKLGFAPRQRILLQQVFQQEQVSNDLLEKSGLLVQTNQGEWRDRFYQRIMFPISNEQGKIIAFSGRLLETETVNTEKQPKYLNSPETPLFNKRVTLFNFHKARSEVRKENQIVLFEGFMDVISAWSAGVKNGVASMGTSLTNEQIQMIRRIAKRVVLCYDGDSAGVEATFRGVQLLSQNTPLEIAVARLPDKLDPDEFIRKNGATAFKELLEHGTESVLAFKMYYYRKERNLNNEQEKLAYLDDVLNEMSTVTSVIERELYFKQLAEEFSISIEALTEQFHQLKQQRKPEMPPPDDWLMPPPPPPDEVPQVAVKAQHKKTQVEKAEEILLYRMLHESELVLQLSGQSNFTFVHEDYQQLFILLEGFIQLNGEVVPTEFLNLLESENLRNLVTEILYLDLSPDSSDLEIQDCLKVIRKDALAVTLKQKQQAQREAARLGDKKVELELAIEIVQLMKQIKN